MTSTTGASAIFVYRQTSLSHDREKIVFGIDQIERAILAPVLEPTRGTRSLVALAHSHLEASEARRVTVFFSDHAVGILGGFRTEECLFFGHEICMVSQPGI
jgi:hypothetical protein